MLNAQGGLFLLCLYKNVEESKPILFYLCRFWDFRNNCCELSLLQLPKQIIVSLNSSPF